MADTPKPPAPLSLVEVLPPGERPAPGDVGPPIRREFQVSSEYLAKPPQPKDPPGLAAAKRIDRKLRRKVERIALHELAASEIEDFEVDENGQPVPVKRPEGWSETKFRIAKDGRKPKRDRPGYLDSAQRILSSYQAQDAAKQATEAPALNVVYVAKVEVNNSYAYPVQEISDE